MKVLVFGGVTIALHTLLSYPLAKYRLSAGGDSRQLPPAKLR